MDTRPDLERMTDNEHTPKKEEIQLKDLDESSIDDLIHVCSSKFLDDPVHRRGIEIKREWLSKILKEDGSVAKIAYYRGKPVGQILYWPQSLQPTRDTTSEKALNLHCAYNPFPKAQRKGIARRLILALLEDAKRKSYRYVVTHTFDTEQFLSLREFYTKMGFRQVQEGKLGEMYRPIADERDVAEPTSTSSPWLDEAGEDVLLPEDEGRIVAFYTPVCQFSYGFALKAADLVRELAPDLTLELISTWEEPEEYLRRGRNWMTVNGKPIKAGPFNKDEFLQEVEKTLQG